MVTIDLERIFEKSVTINKFEMNKENIFKSFTDFYGKTGFISITKFNDVNKIKALFLNGDLSLKSSKFIEDDFMNELRSPSINNNIDEFHDDFFQAYFNNRIEIKPNETFDKFFVKVVTILTHNYNNLSYDECEFNFETETNISYDYIYKIFERIIKQRNYSSLKKSTLTEFEKKMAKLFDNLYETEIEKNKYTTLVNKE